VNERRIVAYESHGGTLTDIYVQEHLRTLRKVIPLRKVELEAVAEIAQWQATIRLVAHQVTAPTPPPIIIDGLAIAFELCTFSDLIDATEVTDNLLAVLNETFIPPLNARRTPESVRAKVLNCMTQPLAI
jgi:hypothetical protein